MTELNIVVLVLIGVHPASGRSRRAEQDTRAAELNLRSSGLHLQVLCADDPYAEAPCSYPGMGLGHLSVPERPTGVDALPALAERLCSLRVQLVLTGNQVGTGGDSEVLSSPLAERLDWPLAVGLTKVRKVEDSSAQVLQALPRGQRRWLRVYLPFVASVDNTAPVARQGIFGPARRSKIEVHEVEVVDDPLLAEDSLQPARPRPKRLEVIKAKTGAERIKAVTAKAPDGTRQVLKDFSAGADAEAIFKPLCEEGVIC